MALLGNIDCGHMVYMHEELTANLIHFVLLLMGHFTLFHSP